jgi:hypothetical protein
MHFRMLSEVETQMLALESNGISSPWIILAILVVLGIAVGGLLSSIKRQKDLAAFAQQYGFQFTALAGDHHEQYETFEPFDNGHSRSSRNLIHGRRGAIDWEMFDYKYTTGSGKNKQTHHYGIILAKIDLRLSRMCIRREHFFDKLAGLVGFDDIDFESEEFSRKFHVKAEDRKFAYDLIHPEMMEYLMAAPPADWQLGGRIAMITRSRHYKPDELSGLMTLIEGFVERIPHYVRQDRAAV